MLNVPLSFPFHVSRFTSLPWIALVLALTACTAPGASPSETTANSPAASLTPRPALDAAPVETTLTIFAASSLTDAFTEMSQAFAARHSEVAVVFNFASSSDLATQLAEGAPADVFASANNNQMQNVVAAGRIAGEPVEFLTNQLIIIVPADNPAGLETLADLANEGVKLISALPGVPIRLFTEEMLGKASADPAYGPGFRNAVLANLVSEEANVRQLAAKIALGEADAGVVYKSDVTPDMAGRVKVINIPDEFNVLAVYPIGVIKDAPAVEVGQAFVAFTLSPEGQAILAKWGFGPAPNGSTGN